MAVAAMRTHADKPGVQEYSLKLLFSLTFGTLLCHKHDVSAVLVLRWYSISSSAPGTSSHIEQVHTAGAKAAAEVARRAHPHSVGVQKWAQKLLEQLDHLLDQSEGAFVPGQTR